MDRLWGLKFTTMFQVPGNALWCYFDDEEQARAVFDLYTVRLAMKPHEACEALVFDDLLGRNSMRVDMFPYCVMLEIGPCELMWEKINKKIKAAQAAVSMNAGAGFKGEVQELVFKG